MGNLYTAEATSQNSALTNVASRVTDGSTISGSTRSFRVTHTSATDDEADDVLYLVKLPTGARLDPYSLKAFAAGDAGTVYAIDAVGDLADPDRYSSTSVDLGGGAAAFEFTPNATAVSADYQVGDDAADTGWITATLHTMTSPAATTIVFTGNYSLAN